MQPSLTSGEEERWSVFVGGAEVNDSLLDFDTACVLAQEYLDDDYNDVMLMQYDTGETIRV